MTQIYSRKVTHSVASKETHTIRRRVNTAREARILLRIKNNLERRFAKRVYAVMRKAVGSSMYLYRQFGDFNVNVFSRNMQDDFQPLIEQHFKRVYRTIFEFNENKYNTNNQKQEAEAFIFGRARDFEELVAEYYNSRNLILAGVSINIANRISRDIDRLRVDGLTLDQIAREIASKYRFITRARANMIARTETHNAAGLANHRYHGILQEDTGMQMMKKWVPVNDLRVRDAHGAMANKPAIPMDEPFEVGGELMQHVGDPNGGLKNIINCRCSIIYVDARDMD